MQYGTYKLFSWDIMEPIACMLESFDMIIAYLFWMSTQEDYDLEDISNVFQGTERTRRIYKSYGFNVADYNETKDMLKYLRTKKNVLSDNIDHVL